MNVRSIVRRWHFSMPNAVAQLLIVVAVLLSIWPAIADAAPPHVSVRFTPLSPRTRVAAPISGIWEVIYNGSELLEGELRLELNANNGKQRIVIPDVVVTPGTVTRFRGMLPVIDVSSYGNGGQDLMQVEMKVQFVANDGTLFPPESTQLMFRNPQMQSFNICIADPYMAGGIAVERQLAEGLAFERFNSNPDDKSLVTAPAHVAPRDLPNNPLGYCAFDMLLLADEGFMETDATQLTAIGKWVRAGGSLCIMPGTAIDAPHLEFLNELAKSANSKIIFITDADGRLSASGADEQAEFALLRVDLGRVAVGLFSDKSKRNTGSAQFRDMSAFLWKIKATHLQSILKTGTFLSGKIPQRHQNRGQPRALDTNFEQPLSLAVLQATSRASDWSESLIGQLMPKNFRFVPLWLMCGLLFVFLLVIGPVDYFLLGALKIRKLTWILFPLTSFAFAYITVAVANTYMGVTNETHSYQFVDVGNDGEVLRANRLELHYNGAAQHSETELSDALFTPLDTSASSFHQHRQTMQEDDLPLLVGRIPQQVTVVQDIPQWTPRLSRQFWIAPSEKSVPKPKFDFASLSVDDFATPQTQASLARRLKQSIGEQCSIYILNRRKIATLAKNFDLFSNPQSSSMAQQRMGNTTRTAAAQSVNNRNINSSGGDAFIRQVSAPIGKKVFNIVSQVSPAGGWSFDDLAMLDVSDPDQWLLIVAVPRDDDIIIYRKLYRRHIATDSSSTTP